MSVLEVHYKHQSFIAVQVNINFALRKPLVQSSMAKSEHKYQVASRLCFLKKLLSAHYLKYENAKDCPKENAVNSRCVFLGVREAS